MGNVSFARNLQVRFAYGGCGVRSVTCMGQGRMLVVFEEVGPTPPGYPQRLFRSADNGLTWIELPAYFSANNLWLWGSYSPGSGVVLVGNEGPQFGTGPNADDAIARTDDAGATWGKAIADTLFDFALGDFWDVRDFVPLDGGEILAVGFFSMAGVDRHVLRSSDNGMLFASPQSIVPSDGTFLGIFSGAYVGNDVVVLGASFFNRSARVYRSTNRGATFSEIILPNTQHGYAPFAGSLVTSVVHLGGGIMLACASQIKAAGQFPPKLWRSTDSGATWTEITNSLPGWVDFQATDPATLAVFDANRVVLAINGRPDKLSESNWRFSEDAGLSWTVCPAGPYTLASSEFIVIRDMGLADNGAVIAVVDATGPPFDNNEIWRGVPTGFAAQGPCASPVPIAAAIAGPPLDCGHALGVNPCPQPC